MNILMIKQPYPMGNHHIIPFIADYLREKGNNVYIFEQLNADLEWHEAADKILDQLSQEKWDFIYYEMLDKLTFNIVSKLKGIKVLCYASKGIFNTFEEILDYKGIYYDRIFTNSYKMKKFFENHGVKTSYFKYYIANIGDSKQKLIYEENYVFLGGGHQRIDKNNKNYELEQDLIFFNPKVIKYGGGFPQNFESYAGLLPPEEIGSLYKSSGACLSMIEPTQRSMGMINNRYSEILASGGLLISPQYSNEIEWGEIENFMLFADNSEELEGIPISKYKELKSMGNKFYKENIEPNFFNSLNTLLK